ncbi:cytochrome c oxidase assembly protein PET191-domain-containing protein [Kalaharituber pfeilii]|nr:cytochrome c oxidase assembly protein PET191-domain-containing protein [Kalaharituber pfeilii]
MPSSCKEIRQCPILVLKHSDCVFVERNKPADCLRPPLVDTLPARCQQLKKGYGDCKRGMVDMRKRFRGNYPVALSTELEGGGKYRMGEGGGQLYAGRPYFAQQNDNKAEDDNARQSGNRT